MGRRLFLVFSTLILMVFISTSGCGKVTQVTKKEDEKRAFSVNFTLPLTASSDSKITVSSASPGAKFTVESDPIFLQLSGIKADGKITELAWGKSTLNKIEKPGTRKIRDAKTGKMVTANTVIYTSSAYKKDNVRISKASHKWAYMSFEQNKKSWKGSLNSVPQDYPLYLVAVYDREDTVALSLFTPDEITKKGNVDLNDLTAYDHFLAVLLLIDLQSSKAGLKDTHSLTDLNTFFSPALFDTINYTFPKNEVKKFRVKQPAFVFSGKQEKSLLNLLNLAKINDRTEFDVLVKKLKKKKEITASAEKILRANAKLFEEAPSSE